MRQRQKQISHRRSRSPLPSPRVSQVSLPLRPPGPGGLGHFCMWRREGRGRRLSTAVIDTVKTHFRPPPQKPAHESQVLVSGELEEEEEEEGGGGEKNK